VKRWIVVAPIVYRPARGWKLFAGPGFERAEEEEEMHREPREGEPDDDDDHAETHFLFRVGVGYAVEFAERYSVGPSISFDFVRESGRWAKAVVVGLTIGSASSPATPRARCSETPGDRSTCPRVPGSAPRDDSDDSSSGRTSASRP
jgi:hypothetical protein